MKRFVYIFASILVVSVYGNFTAQAAGVSCTVLIENLSYGNNGTQVLALQNYLYAAGYMTALPNGHFGPSTFAGVKQFQSSHGVSAIGVVGPQTRAAITQASCQTTTTPVIQQPASPVIQTPTTTPVTSTNSIIVTLPHTGDTLTIGKTFTVTWTGPSSVLSHTILLEDTSGVGAGYLAMGAFPNHAFNWKVGSILSSNTPVAPGTYRIRIIDAIRGSQTGDKTSDPFTIVAPPLTVNTVFPSTVPADNNTSVVLYGSGFTSATAVYFDQLHGSSAQTNYVSSDGRVLVFSVPTSVSTGRHLIYISSSYTSSATTTNTTAFVTVIPPSNE